MRFTIFGGEGFIGRNLAVYLRTQGHEVWLPSRAADELSGVSMGHVVYAIGLTADFRSRPFETVEAHVCKLARLLGAARFDSWLYLSSTRVYGGLPPGSIASEGSPLPQFPDLDGLYNLSKLTGEALCLAQANNRVRVVRLSNVCGPGQGRNFLALLLEELTQTGKLLIREAPESSKDYIALNDVLPMLERIVLHGRQRLYNLASGKPLNHAELASKLVSLTGAEIRFADDAPRRAFPPISIKRIRQEFGFRATDIAELLPNLIAAGNQPSPQGVNLEPEPHRPDCHI